MLDSKDNSVFMKDTYEKFLKKLNNQDFTKFSKLKNNFDRFEFVLNLPLIKEYKIEISECNKNLPEAKSLKEKGNSAFQTGDFRKAHSFYTQSLLKSPLGKDTQDLSIIRANRSAALYHLGRYQEALLDIEAALTLGYPHDLLYKLKDRKAKCFLALKQNKRGLEELQETLTALDDAKLPLERRLKWQKDIQIMIAMMTKNKVQDEKEPNQKIKQKKVSFERNSVYVSASDAIDIKQDAEAGRYATAKRDMKVGEVFLEEEAHCSVILEHQSDTHCFHCLRRTDAGEPCDRCDRVKFCSVQCQTAALKTHHSTECKFLDSLWKSGLSVTCLMALRMISQRNHKYFMKLKSELMRGEESTWACKQYTHSDYLAVSNLVTHEEKRTPEALLQKTFVAVYLFRCLQEGSYFQGLLKEEEKVCFKLIGGLLLKNLQLLQFNAHEIFELECPKKDLSASKSVFVGAGLYPTLALFNHSCQPSIVRHMSRESFTLCLGKDHFIAPSMEFDGLVTSDLVPAAGSIKAPAVSLFPVLLVRQLIEYFDGTKVIVRTVRPIKKGDIVAENYGPIFTEMPRERRQKELKERYWFNCECKACSEDWPMLNDMDTQTLRFRCESPLCKSIIIVPALTTSFVIKCVTCRKNINILKGLKVLQDSENIFRLAQELLNSGEPRRAAAKYSELLELLDETLAPPFPDYLLCQQGLRTSFLALGNTHTSYT